jgi:ABC-type glycerol-3-phosphate transport system substrate-binding protein
MRNSMVRRLVGISVSLALLAFLLLGLNAALTSSTHAAPLASTGGEPDPIVFWHIYSGAAKSTLDQLVAEFNTTNQFSITVQAVQAAGSYGALSGKVVSTIQQGETLPNLVLAYPNAAAEFARYGAVRFLDEYLSDPDLGIDASDFEPGILDTYRLPDYGGQMAGLQYGRSIEVMYYNADLLASHGLTVPQTWDAFRAAAMALTTETISGTLLRQDASTFAGWLWTRGGDVLTAGVPASPKHRDWTVCCSSRHWSKVTMHGLSLKTANTACGGMARLALSRPRPAVFLTTVQPWIRESRMPGAWRVCRPCRVTRR